MNERNQKRDKLKDQAYNLMALNTALCGDDTHRVTQIMYHEKYGVLLTKEQLKFIGSTDRARRDVLKKNPSMDKRKVTTRELEPNDRKYFAEGV